MCVCVCACVHVLQAKTGPAGWKWISDNAGKPHDEQVVQKAVKEVEEFCHALQSEGVTVHRPEPIRWDQLGTFRTPYYEDGGEVCFRSLFFSKQGNSGIREFLCLFL